MREKYKYLSQNVFLFTLSGFVPKILSFILIPIYTAKLSTAEYGISELIGTTVSLLIPIFTFDIQDAVMRFTLDKDYDKTKIFSIGIKIDIYGSAIVAIGVLILYFIRVPGIKTVYLLFTFIMFFSTALTNTISLFCRGINNVKTITVSSIINSLITLMSNILFLVYFGWGITGYLLANTLGSISVLIYCFWDAKLYKYIKIGTNSFIQKSMIAYSFPLIFNVIAWWINNASDRYILSWEAGAAITGIYSISYKIPNLLSTFQNVFAQAWSISAIKEFDSDDTDGFIGKMYTLMNFAMVSICSIIMIFDVPVAKLLYSKDFFEAWKYVPPLLISVVFNAMSLFIGSIFTAVKDSKTLAISTIVGAAINTICNFIFIHFWGAYGAAVATLIGYFVTFLMRHIILRNYIHMRIKWRRDAVCYSFIFLQMILAWNGIKTVFFQIMIFACILLFYHRELHRVIEMIKMKVMVNFSH